MSTVEIETALSALSSPDKNTQKEANKYLQDFQKRSAAWNVSRLILSQSDSSPAAKVFAAQTIKQKIQFDLSQLDSASQYLLRDQIITWLNTDDLLKSKPILNQLSLSLVDLIIQMPSWESPTLGLLDIFGSDQRLIPVLLNIWMLLPEEFLTNRHIPLETTTRNQRINVVLSTPSERVFEVLCLFIQNYATNIDIQSLTLSCLCSWLRSRDIDVNKLATSPIIPVLFKALRNDDLFESACDNLCEIIACVGGDAINQNMSIVSMISKELLSSSSIIQSNLDDCEKLQGLCRVYSDAAEYFCPLLIVPNSSLTELLEPILFFTGSDNLEIVRLTFNFWYVLSDLLVENKTNNSTIWQQVYTRLFDMMIKHLHYSKTNESWTAMELDEFRDFRHIIGGNIKDCVSVLGEQKALEKPYSILTQFIDLPTEKSWQTIEASLFTLRIMASKIDVNESNFVPRIMEMFPRLPNHPKVKYAAIMLIGRFSDWSKHHPQFLSYQLTFISQGFENLESKSAAALSLNYLCESCGSLMHSFLPQLLPFYKNMINALSPEEQDDFTSAIAYVISSMPVDQVYPTLQGFVHPIAEQILQLVQTPVSGSEDESVLKIKLAKELLNRLTMFMKVVHPIGVDKSTIHPCIQILKDIWPVLEQLLNLYGNTLPVSEAFARLVRASIDSYGESFSPLLAPLANKIVPLYEHTKLSGYLWVTRQLVEKFSGDSSSIYLLVQEMMRITFIEFEAKSPESVPDIVEDFFGMSQVLIRVSPKTFISSRISSPLVVCALACIKIEKLEPCLSVLKFLESLFELEDVIRIQVITEHGSTLITRLMQGIFDWFPRDRDLFFNVSSIFTLLAFKLGQPQLTSQILEQIYQFILPISDEIVVESEKQDFIRRLSL